MASVSLAEPRRRQKWTLNPRGNLWANDENKFGHKLMEKMGWEKGKGLGANQDGIVTHVKVKQKDNQKGVGFEGHDDTWLAHQDDFQAVLAALNVEHGAAGEGLTEGEKKASLEAISRKSKRRVHYQKFVKGKDSSNYSAEDMGCILGTKSEKVGAKARAVVEEAKGVDEEENNGKFKQASGSYQDYFAAKMAALKAQGRFKEVPDWKEEDAFGGGKTLGLGAGNGRVVDREIQRESLLCPDYLKAAKEQREGGERREAEEAKVRDEEEQVGEGEESGKRKRKKQRVEPSTDEAKEEEVDPMEEGEREVKKSKKRKKDKKERSPAADEDALPQDDGENLEPLAKKKKKNKKERELEKESSALGEEDEEKNLKKATEGPIEEHKQDNSGSDSKKSKKKKKKDFIAETIDENQVPVNTISEDQVDCVEEKQKKKKSKKSKKEKSSDEEKEEVEDSGCEEAAGVKVKKTKKSKKEKSKSDEGADSCPKVKNVTSKEEIAANAAELEDEEPHAAAVEIDSKKKKKKSKKKKAVEEEEPIVTADADNVLKKNYPEAPGVLKGSNLLAIPGYGAPQ